MKRAREVRRRLRLRRSRLAPIRCQQLPLCHSNPMWVRRMAATEQMFGADKQVPAGTTLGDGRRSLPGTTLNLVRATGDQRGEGRLWDVGARYV